MTTVAILQIITIFLLVASFYVWQRNRFFLDAERIAHMLASHLLADHEGELFTLDHDGVKKYARHKYMQMVTEWGLPSAAVDRVAQLVANTIAATQGQQTAVSTSGEGNPFYA